MNRTLKAERRKRWARVWWIGLHVYGYAAPLYAGTLSVQVLSIPTIVLLATVAIANLCQYIFLQISSPGYIEPLDEQSIQASDSAKTIENNSNDDVQQLLDTADTHQCDKCHITQPLRAKHCDDCNRCVRQYDHHCDCAGTCIGEDNRHAFIRFLFLQTTECWIMLKAESAAFTWQPTIEEWFRANIAYVFAWYPIFCAFLVCLLLLLYQAYLISTNQTSWEHGRRRSITYLQSLPYDYSPFTRGCLLNWWTFVTRRDANVWIHASSSTSDHNTSIKQDIS